MADPTTPPAPAADGLTIRRSRTARLRAGRLRAAVRRHSAAARPAVLAARLTPRSVRARTTLAACTTVGAALLVASAALLGLLHANLEHTVESGTREQARAVARLAADEQLTPLLPLDHGTDFIQVVDARGRVVATSQNVAGRPALAPVGAPDGRTTFDLRPLGEEHRQRVATVTATTPNGPVTVHVGSSLRTVDAAQDVAAAALLALCPLLLLTVGVLTWRTTGRALAPVEAIRAGVAAVGDRQLDLRVPVPAADDEIARLAGTMNAMLARLEAAGARQRRFIADASHELRSPLAVLRTQLEVALAHPDPAVRTALLEGALEDTDRLQALATDLLLLARLDSAGPDRPDDSVDLADLVDSTVRARAGDPHPVRLDLAEGITVAGSPLWLGRLLTNLLDNAQRHAGRGVTVRLYRDPGAGRAVLDVANDGPAVAPEDGERIFERFTRLDDARSRDHGGAGLGLPIARDIARHHGGGLALVPAADGTVFRTHLPIAAS
ncbi:HAMP domain-containing sensor histidine kinase [Kitasatospora sp. NPDC085879]|uniref:sensor histidine kinase n=1 Tax=Kitasatospora sp. NPDC085879 TaxID=3154769 RepID=UPI00343523A4